MQSSSQASAGVSLPVIVVAYERFRNLLVYLAVYHSFCLCHVDYVNSMSSKLSTGEEACS